MDHCSQKTNIVDSSSAHRLFFFRFVHFKKALGVGFLIWHVYADRCRPMIGQTDHRTWDNSLDGQTTIQRPCYETIWTRYHLQSWWSMKSKLPIVTLARALARGRFITNIKNLFVRPPVLHLYCMPQRIVTGRADTRSQAKCENLDMTARM